MGSAPVNRKRSGHRLFRCARGCHGEWTGRHPSSWIKGRVLTTDVTSAPTTFSPFTQGTVGGVGTAGGSLTLMAVPVLGYSKTGTKTIDLELQLDLVGRVLAPGNYTGTLNIRAVTQ